MRATRKLSPRLADQIMRKFTPSLPGRPRLGDDLKAAVIHTLETDIVALESLTGFDLSDWRE